jgi:hypothetical protein
VPIYSRSLDFSVKKNEIYKNDPRKSKILSRVNLNHGSTSCNLGTPFPLTSLSLGEICAFQSSQKEAVLTKHQPIFYYFYRLGRISYEKLCLGEKR